MLMVMVIVAIVKTIKAKYFIEIFWLFGFYSVSEIQQKHNLGEFYY